MNSKRSLPLGLAGRLARTFVGSKLTPLLVIASFLLGLLALFLTPREEEPQIVVPMVDVAVMFPGASPREVEERITTPLEKLLWGVPGVEYLYSVSRAGSALITVRFKVGTALEPAVVRVHHKLREHLPERAEGVEFPVVRSYTIDDVPFLALTFHSRQRDDFALRTIALQVSHELAEVPDVSRAEVIGGRERTLQILPDVGKMRRRNVSLLEFVEPLVSTNVEGRVGTTRGPDPEHVVEVGAFLNSASEVSHVVVGIKGGEAVRVSDVADVRDGPAERVREVLFVKKGMLPEPAVTLSLAKRPGTNATRLAEQVLEKVARLRATTIPADVEVSVTRNYGETAKEKSNTLIEHLLIASLSVVLLIGLILGTRPAWVVAAAVPVTLALTLLIYYLFGYTLNRVTLFALIFSIGILVDDAIVVIENIHRHLHSRALRRGRSLRELVIAAVDEVGNPTILATFTVIAAILPMAFVSGLMGPYMRPIPVGASMAMLFSLVVAFTISPWAAERTHGRLYRRLEEASEGKEKSSRQKKNRLDRLYDWFMGSLLDRTRVRVGFVLVILILFGGVFLLVYGKVVRVKMLPFDNKSELQVMIDVNDGAPLRRTRETAIALGRSLEGLSEVRDYQIYVGTSAPVNFNGLVRHYFLRSASHQADLQVNLVPKSARTRSSHDFAKLLRTVLEPVAFAHGARLKIVEIPPGPPVLATLVAEVYGPTSEEQHRVAGEVRRFFLKTDGVVDVDDSRGHPQPLNRVSIDRTNASLQRVPADRVYQSVSWAMAGGSLGLLHDPTHPEPVPLLLRFPEEARGDLSKVIEMRVVSNDGSFVPLSALAKVESATTESDILHKNLKRVVYVTADLAGAEESPVYAIGKLNRAFDGLRNEVGGPIPILSTQAPELTDRSTVKWDGEWQITYEVFRDLGLAFAVVMILIYLLVVGWFESFVVPLIIMIPIPLSLIGIVPGHWVFGAFFTATSMIGFIAGAGIIVRNSIILVDFIELKLSEGTPLREAVLEAGEVRFRPMLLTAAAVVVGSAVMLFDPIFQGLAISLMTGEVAATLLSRFAVPLLYYKLVGRRRAAFLVRT